MYYTSRPVAEVLVEWALEGSSGPVLDPSFGGCAFLDVALKRLVSADVDSAPSLVYGVDIDPATQIYRDDLVALDVPERQLLIQDFFETTVEDFGIRFSAVIGNPPYVRHHLLANGRAEMPRRCCTALNMPLDARADLWAYFVAHATSFLAPGARMILLLPGAALHAQYAKTLFEHLEQKFEILELISVRERFFDDALERSVVLIADGYEQGSCKTEFFSVEGLTDLQSHLTNEREERRAGVAVSDRQSKGAHSHHGLGVDLGTLELYEELQQHSDVVRLGEVAEVRIGVVTGANRLFVRRRSDVERLVGEGVTTVPIVSRSSWLQYPRWTAKDQRNIEAEDGATLLLVIDEDAPLVDALADEIEEGETRGWDRRSHCRSRRCWYALTDLETPSTFLPYMGATAPRLVLNTAQSTSTNAVHRVRWKRSVANRAVAGSWTTLFAFASELHGRAYGGGILKLEPGEVVDALLPLAPNLECLREIDAVARTHGRDAARSLADDLILKGHLGLSQGDLNRLQEGVETRERFRAASR